MFHANSHFKHIIKFIKPLLTMVPGWGHECVSHTGLVLHGNICCGYSLEAPCYGASNEYHNICFHGEIRKIFP